MACVRTWILASAKSTSRPFIQIFLTSSNGIGWPPGSLVVREDGHLRAGAEDGRSIGVRCRTSQCDKSAMEFTVGRWPLAVAIRVNSRSTVTANGERATVILLRAMSSLRGKTAVITGASSGIGRATAIELARRGADLVIGARRGELLEEVAAQCRALGVACLSVTTDVTNRDDCRKLIAAAPRIDVLVN